MIFRFLINITLIIALSKNLLGQDIHFSQYNLSPLNLNPALTGAFTGDYRFIGNHRNQWSSVTNPYSTFGFSFEKTKLFESPISIGLQINQDRAGDSKLNTFQVNPSISYCYKIDSSNLIFAGAQIGMTKQNIDYNPLYFDAQYNGSIYDPTLPNQENFLQNARSYLNINLGFNYSKKLNPKMELITGTSLFNLNSAKQSYFNDNSIRLDLRAAIHSLLIWNYNEKLIFSPRILWLTQGKHKELVIGANSEYIFEKFMQTYRSVYAGISYRNKDALFINGGYKYNNWQLGISYDLNVSKLVPASIYRGGFEISILYIIDNTPIENIIHRICPDYL
ncbi:MAG: hypothetical protein CL853_05680 [Crocinitomicaceae bacterium]|nr:hypothetical protein [Crocinitomicaceae bacterium]|tara:strand:- start:58 stop:1062 length:1005 start_codon:yes stop_codon:yes gene_type:complete